MQLEMWVGNIVYRISQCADEVFGDTPHETVLYGSYARGDNNDESDIDMMVIADVVKESLYMYKKPFVKLSSDFGLEYDVVVTITIKDSETFNKYRDVLPFYQNVKDDGIVF